MVSHRVTRLRELMQMRDLDAMIVSSLHSVRYLTGFTGSHALCALTRRTAVFVTDTRYTLQSRSEVAPLYRRLIAKAGLFDTLARSRIIGRARRIGFEANDVSYSLYRSVRRLFPGATLQPLSELVENLMLLKEPGEIASIKAAARISGRAFRAVLQNIRPGMREREVAAKLSYLQKEAGAEGDAFDIIVASGERAALPHARASEKRIRAGEPVVMDFGCTVNGYSCDITRTVFVGKASRASREVYRAVLDAQEAAIAAARGGMTARELDAKARGLIDAAGYGRYFIHSLGHGLGLRIHERPRISSLSSERLKANMVVTIEPGVYIPGWGGVRIEDDVVLRDGGCDLLTGATKELLVL